MITEIKDLLTAVIARRSSAATVVRSVKKESTAIMSRTFPLIALITNPGAFDGAAARTVRYYDDQTASWKERYVRGNRVLPVVLRCWDTSEDATDVLFSRIIPAIPSRWEYDNFVGDVEIGSEEHSDHAGHAAGVFLSVVEVRFSAPAALEEGLIPTIDQITLEDAEVAHR